MSKSRVLTKAEEQVMMALWQIRKGTTHELLETFSKPKPHYNTVSTILKILQDKGFVKAEQVGKSNFYQPTVSKESYSKRTIKKMVKDYFDGSFSNMLSAFAATEDLSLSDLEEIIGELNKQKK